jgi:hypothetical protein
LLCRSLDQIKSGVCPGLFLQRIPNPFASLMRLRGCPSTGTKGGQHSPAGEGVGGPNSDDWRESLILFYYSVLAVGQYCKYTNPILRFSLEEFYIGNVNIRCFSMPVKECISQLPQVGGGRGGEGVSLLCFTCIFPSIVYTDPSLTHPNHLTKDKLTIVE